MSDRSSLLNRHRQHTHIQRPVALPCSPEHDDNHDHGESRSSVHGMWHRESVRSRERPPFARRGHEPSGFPAVASPNCPAWESTPVGPAMGRKYRLALQMLEFLPFVFGEVIDRLSIDTGRSLLAQNLAG